MTWRKSIRVRVEKICFILLFLSAATAAFSQRIVSLAPGLTEIAFALGKGSRLVGVTNFCDYPPQAREIDKIGGFWDVNRESLITLNPDVLLIYPEHEEKLGTLLQKTEIVTVRHNTLEELLRSILTIGVALHAEDRAVKLVDSIRGRLRAVSERVKGKQKIRTLFIAGRNAAELKNMYIIGNKDFINDLLEIAGGTNVYEGEINYPSVSMESVIFFNPDFIFEISAHYEGIADEKIMHLWEPYAMIRAVAKKQIRIIKNSFWLRPGPRVAAIAEELADIFTAVREPIQ